MPQLWPRFKTFGLPYRNWNTEITTTHLQWLATHFDAMFGSSAVPTEATHDILKAANSDVKLGMYFAYLTNDTESWQETWCSNNSYDPEDIYYHYYSDTTVTMRGTNPTSYTWYGYGGGSATSLRQARVPSTVCQYGNGIDDVNHQTDRPMINPTSTAWRRSAEAYCANLLTITVSKSFDFLFLDSFGAGLDGTNNPHLENTIEMRAIFGADVTAAEARNQFGTDENNARQDLKTNVSATLGKTILTVPNCIGYDYWFQWYKTWEDDAYTDYDDVWFETSFRSGLSTASISRLRTMYDRIDAGSGLVLWPQHEFSYGYADPLNTLGLRQFLIGGHWLMWNPTYNENYYAGFHLGSMGYYGGVAVGGGKYEWTLDSWDTNLEYDIGTPVIRSGADSWGITNTNRFYTFASGTGPAGGYTILAREFTGGLVLTKIGSRGGNANIGTNTTTHNLPDTYKLLLADNSLSSPITEITLADSWGAILIPVAITGTHYIANLQDFERFS